MKNVFHYLKAYLPAIIVLGIILFFGYKQSMEAMAPYGGTIKDTIPVIVFIYGYKPFLIIYLSIHALLFIVGYNKLYKFNFKNYYPRVLSTSIAISITIVLLIFGKESNSLSAVIFFSIIIIILFIALVLPSFIKILKIKKIVKNKDLIFIDKLKYEIHHSSGYSGLKYFIASRVNMPDGSIRDYESKPVYMTTPNEPYASALVNPNNYDEYYLGFFEKKD